MVVRRDDAVLLGGRHVLLGLFDDVERGRRAVKLQRVHPVRGHARRGGVAGQSGRRSGDEGVRRKGDAQHCGVSCVLQGRYRHVTAGEKNRVPSQSRCTVSSYTVRGVNRVVNTKCEPMRSSVVAYNSTT